jgi:signal transduction protein with GAF and PtsI domain
MCCAPTAALELYATEGLKREAVHQTTMRSGEGLVGLIAARRAPLSLSDAQAIPAFSYKPETGEEIYASFLGVPILRAGDTLGVLVVQNRASRAYPEEEVEALETAAMVMAEMLATGELQALARPGRRHRAAALSVAAGPRRSTTASALAMWCCTSRAPSSPTSSPMMSRPNSTPRIRHRDHARLDRRPDRPGQRQPRRRTPRRARNLPHVRL